MGIRVNKVMGWGIVLNVREWEHQYDPTDPSKTYTKHEIEDDRIDFDALRETGDDDEDSWYNLTTADLLKFVDDNVELFETGGLYGIDLLRQDIRRFAGKLEKWDPENLYNLLISHDEGAHPGVLVFIPPGYSDKWHRRDDTMDWMEETYPESGEEGQRDHYRFFEKSAGIFPWNGWVRFRGDTPLQEGCDADVLWGDSIRRGNLAPQEYAMLVGSWSDKVPPKADEALLEHLRNDWRPKIPDGIRAIVHFIASKHPKALPDPEGFLNQLRPLTYTYWA